MREAAIELTDHVAALRRRFPDDTVVDWAMAGGLLRPGTALAEALRAAVERQVKGCLLSTAPIDPAGVAAKRAAGPHP